MPATYEEVARESRRMDLTLTSFDEVFVVEFDLDPNDLEPTLTGTEIFGEDDDTKALEYAYTIFPSVRSMPNQDGEAVPLVLSKLTLEQSKGDALHWVATVTYSRDTERGTGGGGAGSGGNVLEYAKINFTIGGNTRHITKSLEVMDEDGTISNPGPIPTCNGEIGSTEDNIDGADIYGGGFAVSITAYYKPSYIDLAFMNMLVAARATMNDLAFLGRSPGEVLFVQATGGGTVVDIIPITFDFLIEDNVSDALDPPFPNLTMVGHDLLDYRFHKSLAVNGTDVIRLLKYRYVHRVYEFYNHNLFGIPL